MSRGLLVIALSLSFLSGCCIEGSQTVRVSGEVTCEQFRGGEIEITLCENESFSCGAGTGAELVTPGSCVATVSLTAPGSFSLEGEIGTLNGDKPDLELHAKLREDPQGAPDLCASIEVVGLSPEDHAGVLVELPPPSDNEATPCNYRR